MREAFAGYSPDLVGLANRAFAENWIDAETREGKQGGAYCAGVAGDVSRVMMNFDGSQDSVSTLAHELGHAFHNVVLAPRTPMQRRLPMALAETASIFCETLLFEHAAAGATDDGERLALLDVHLVGATQTVVDIHSRFLFETELCSRRRRTALSVADMKTAMLDAQEAAYGDGLHPDYRHEYMWAVKGHYFTPFYNWPYTFGLLFGIGLYARYVDDPDASAPATTICSRRSVCPTRPRWPAGSASTFATASSGRRASRCSAGTSTTTSFSPVRANSV